MSDLERVIADVLVGPNADTDAARVVQAIRDAGFIVWSPPPVPTRVLPAPARDGASILPCCDGWQTHGHKGCVWPSGTGEPAVECLYGSDCGGGRKRPCWMPPETCPECTGWRGAHGVTCSRRRKPLVMP